MKRSNLLAGALSFLFAAVGAAADHQESRVLTWPGLQEGGKLLAGHVQPVDVEGWQSLRISNVGSVPTRFPIVVLDRLKPTANNYAVEGQISYQSVEGDAYLEMWTVLPDGRRFFTRTLAETGPLQKITGTSGWRSFSLPFDLLGQSPAHVTLEINGFMPGAGIIDLGPLRIVNLSPEPVRARNIWWSDRMGGLIGGLGGAVIGILLSLAAFLSRKGAPRRPIMTILMLVFALGVIYAVVFIVAAIDSQPFAVCYPLLLIGALATTLPLFAYVKLRRHLRELELRKMQALDT